MLLTKISIGKFKFAPIQRKQLDRIPFCHFLRKGCGLIMGRKITMNGHNGQSVAEVYQDFIFAKTAEGVSDITIRNYHQHLHNISKYLDIEMSMRSLSKRDLEDMICAMRAAGLAHNSISTYVRVLRTFLNWCQKERRANLTIPNMKDKETVKETYSDEELSLLLQKPNANCSFPEYRNCTRLLQRLHTEYAHLLLKFDAIPIRFREKLTVSFFEFWDLYFIWKGELPGGRLLSTYNTKMNSNAADSESEPAVYNCRGDLQCQIIFLQPSIM